MPTHRYFIEGTKLVCPYCQSRNVRLLEQGYYLCGECRKLLWQVRQAENKEVDQ